MDNMDVISRNTDEGYINLVDPRILAEETSQKDNLHLGKAMKSDHHEDLDSEYSRELSSTLI